MEGVNDFIIHLKNDFLQATDEVKKKHLIRDELIQKHNKTKIQDLLISMYFLKRGKISDFQIESASISFFNNSSGSILINFDIEYALGCSDSRIMESDYKKFHFKINDGGKSLNLTLHDIPEREPDEI